MTVREQIQQLGKELLTLAGLQADMEERVRVTKEKLEKMTKDLDENGMITILLKSVS